MLLLQGLFQLLETDVMVRCRQADANVVKVQSNCCYDIPLTDTVLVSNGSSLFLYTMLSFSDRSNNILLSLDDLPNGFQTKSC